MLLSLVGSLDPRAHTAVPQEATQPLRIDLAGSERARTRAAEREYGGSRHLEETKRKRPASLSEIPTYACLCVSLPDSYTAFGIPQRAEMSWPCEVFRFCSTTAAQLTCSQRPVVSGDARCCTMAVVHGHGVSRLMWLLVLRNHHGKGQLCDALRVEGDADEARRVLDEEGHLFGCDIGCWEDEIALVLPVLGVEDEDKLIVPDSLDGRVDGVKLRAYGASSRAINGRRDFRC